MLKGSCSPRVKLKFPTGWGRGKALKVSLVQGGADCLPSMSWDMARRHRVREAAHTLIMKNSLPSLLTDSYVQAAWPRQVPRVLSYAGDISSPSLLWPATLPHPYQEEGCHASGADVYRVRGCSLQDGSSRGWACRARESLYL